MPLSARAIYDFTGDEAQGELSLKAGDEVTIHRQDIGDGWWEGESNGRTGLFPETYVELQQGGSAGAVTELDSGSDGEWMSDGEGEGWEEEEQAGGGAPPMPAGGGSSVAGVAPRSQSFSGAISTDTYGRADTLKRSINRMSVFVKSGAEGFLIGAVKDRTMDPAGMLHMSEGPAWVAGEPLPLIKVEHAGSRSKFKGLKNYEAYFLTGMGNVERRYKHFVWLHERLKNKYSCVCVPPLPDKSHASKYGESFVEKRREKLQAWINRVVRHPILSQDKLSLMHFLTCPPGDMKAWKLGKRKAEKDDFVGATFFKLISPDVPCPRSSDQDIERFGTFISDFNKVLKKNIDTTSSHCDRLASGFSKEYKKLSAGFLLLSEAFGKGGGQVSGASVNLAMAMGKAAICLEEVGERYSAEPRTTHLPWLDGLKEYQGLAHQFSDAIVSSKSASTRLSEIVDNEEADTLQREAVRSRCETIHTLTLCEMNHFHEQRRNDFRDMVQGYLDSQMKFHLELAEKYKAAKEAFEALDY